MKQIDIKDRKILYQLDLNARQSFSEIAKKVGLSKEVTNYRIKRLESLGIIKGYYALINMSRLGYICNRFFIKFRDDSPKKEKEIIEFFVNHPKYWWVDSIDGFRDIGVGSWEKSIAICQLRREELMNKYRQNIKKLEHSFYTGFYIYRRDYLVNKKVKDSDRINYIVDCKVKIDEKDAEILRLVAANARIPITELATNIKLTVLATKFRLRKLVRNKIIECFRPMIDLEKTGYYWYKIEFFLKDYSKKFEMLNYFASHPNIVYAYEATSEADLEVELEVESYEKFRAVLNELRTKFESAIDSYRHLMWTKEHKILFFSNE